MKIKNILLLFLLLATGLSAHAQKPGDAPVIETTPMMEGTPPAPPEIAVKLGQSTTSADDLKVSFLSVDEDSRCPEGVNCIWAGNAKVSIQVSKTGAKPMTLALETQRQGEPQTYLNYQIYLISLAPYPKDGVAINKADYVARVGISEVKEAATKGHTEPANAPVEMRLIARQSTYGLDLNGLTEAEYSNRIKPQASVDKEGQATPRLMKMKLPPAPKVDLELEIRNTGKTPLQIWIGGDGTRLDLDLQGPGAISVVAQMTFTMEYRMPKTITIEPGKAWTMPIRELNYGMRGVGMRAFWTKIGNYSLAATFSTAISPAPEGAQKTGDDEKFGQVKLVSEPINLEVVTAEAQDHQWQKLFWEEKWYQDQAGEEQVFRGTLESIPQTDMATTLMRTSLYKLGNRTIYTGGKPHPVLDALAGKTVRIQGKAVDMELEGQQLKEIWPGQIKLGAFDVTNIW